MATLSMKTMIMALLASGIAMGSGDFAFAKANAQGADPAQVTQRVEKRVDRALSSTDATADQKKQVSQILQAAFKDLRTLRDKRIENRKAMEAALQAPTIDPARLEAIRVEQMKVADEASKRFTKALEDAGNTLSASQRQAFFKSWNERMARHRG